jgi:hypothetical protein
LNPFRTLPGFWSGFDTIEKLWRKKQPPLWAEPVVQPVSAASGFGIAELYLLGIDLSALCKNETGKGIFA